MADLFGRWLAPAILALVPALFRLRRGQAMARHLDDPAFPERLQGSRTLLTGVFAAVLAVEIAVWPGQTWWSLPLLLLSVLAAGWPLRRAMYGETWNVGTYVWFYVRLFVGIYGFWIFLASAPWLTRFDQRPWSAPLLVGVLLLIWNERHSAMLRWMLRARPIAPSSLLERCRAIVSRSGVASPRIEYVDMNGGVLVNALALPDTGQSTVLFTSSLLERLDEDETAAIFAHEVAHLEHFNPKYLRKLRWAGFAVIAAAVTIGPLLHSYAPRLEWLVWAWPFCVLAYITVLTSARQKHETESDVRAAALTGDAEGLVRGLVKLYALARMPRRLDPNVEVTASHPSLARRVQAIRAAAGVTPVSLDQAVTLTNGATVVTLHADRLAWTEADGTSHAMPYASLDELRLEAGEAGAARLSAADAHGRRWTVPIADADVARAQAALDIVDARLRPAPTGAGAWKTLGTLVALLALVSALGAGQLAPMLVALVSVLFFERPLVRAAGVAGLVGAALALRDGGQREMTVILLLSAALLIYISTRDRRDGFSKRASYAISALGVLALLSLAPLAVGGGRLLATHQVANRWPSGAVYALAFAAAGWSPRSRRWRIASMSAAVAGAGVLVVGDTRTIDAVMRDPFLQKVEPPAVAHLGAPPASRVVFEFTPARVSLSPRAESVAAAVATNEHDDHFTYFVGRAGGTLTEVEADAIRFVDERRLLLARSNGAATILRLVDAATPAVAIWEQELDLNDPSIAVDRAGQRWQVLGHDMKGRLSRASGAVSGGDVERRDWMFSTDRGAATPLASSGTRLLVSVTDYSGSENLAALGPMLYWLRPWSSTTQFTIVDGANASPALRSKLSVQCRPGPYMDEGPLCVAHDGSRYHLGILGTDEATITPLAKFDRAMTWEVAPGWVTGWWEHPFALDRRDRRLVIINDEYRANRFPHLVTASEESIGVLWSNPANIRHSVLEIHPRQAISIGQLP